MSATFHLGNCLGTLKAMPDNSVDSIITDPPYGLSFMGKKWDYDVPSVEIWAECLRVLKAGGHLLAFAGTRTQHRMAVRIEDAGFEIRDMLAWVYGSGFPKSHDVSKAIDKAAGVEREVVSEYNARGFSDISPTGDGRNQWAAGKVVDKSAYITAPTTEAAKQWQGFGTALKPALEPITLARKPLIGTVAANVLVYGTGGINIDGCRVGIEAKEAAGRWPANFIHDGSDEVVRLFPQTSASKAGARGGSNPNPMDWGNGRSDGGVVKGHDDNGGSASRFFYCAKASNRDRDEGLDGFLPAKTNDGRKVDADNAYQRGATLRQNIHPTVKPTDLMRYLCRLITPPNGVILDPFMGSGSTGKAALLEGFGFIGCELSPEYLEIAKARIEAVQKQEAKTVAKLCALQMNLFNGLTHEPA